MASRNYRTPKVVDFVLVLVGAEIYEGYGADHSPDVPLSSPLTMLKDMVLDMITNVDLLATGRLVSQDQVSVWVVVCIWSSVCLIFDEFAVVVDRCLQC